MTTTMTKDEHATRTVASSIGLVQRVSGTVTLRIDTNWVYAPVQRLPLTIEYRLANAGGYRAGRGVGWLEITSLDPFTTVHHAEAVAFGHGAYDGLQWRESMTEFTSVGTISAPGAG
jgi:hypothetical protein